MPRNLDFLLRIPGSLIFFVATGAVFIAQLIPILGVGLMLFGAAYWSVILVNLGFLGVLFEACYGRVSRLWLVLPLAWCCFYGWFAYADYKIIEQEHVALAVANSKVKIPFDPNRESLVVPPVTGIGDWLVAYTDVPVVYEDRTDARTHSTHYAIRLAPIQECRDPQRRNAGMTVTRFSRLRSATIISMI